VPPLEVIGVCDIKSIVDLVTSHLPALTSGFVGGLLAEPVKAWFVEPLKEKALARRRAKTMRLDLYRSLARDLALLARLERLNKMSEWPANLRQIAEEEPGTDPAGVLQKWLNGNLLEDLTTETFDEWKRAYPADYLLLPEADIIRDFYKRLKVAVDFNAEGGSIEQRIEKYLYAYSWLLGHARQGLLDRKLLTEQLAKVEKQFSSRMDGMLKDVRTVRRSGLVP
jgi:hypothetical protein